MSVRALRRGSIAASRVQAPAGGTFTFYSDAADAYIAGGRTAADGGGGSVNQGDCFVGMQSSGATNAYETFLSFDTSSVTGTIQSVTLSLYGTNNTSTTDFTLQVAAYDWGSAVETADWRSITTLSGLPVLASKHTSGWATGAYNELTSTAQFLTAINTSGMTRLIVYSSRHAAGSVPGTTEFVGFRSADQTGTDQDPKLVIVTA